MKLTLLVEHEDYPEEIAVVATSADVIALERTYEVPATSLSGGDLRLEWLAFCAWNSLRRGKRTTKSFDEWIDGVTSVRSPSSKKDDGDEGGDGAGEGDPASSDS